MEKQASDLAAVDATLRVSTASQHPGNALHRLSALVGGHRKKTGEALLGKRRLWFEP
jgi:hypothetical protein